MLREDDLAPMVDAAALPSPDFGAIPTGSFLGGGTSFPTASNASGGGHVVWSPSFVHRTDCTGVSVAAWSGAAELGIAPSASANHNRPMPGGTSQLNIAPLMNGIGLLGEAGKVTSVSAYRFASVRPVAAAGKKGVVVELRGKPGEKVPLLFASAASGGAEGGSDAVAAAYKCTLVAATIGADGTATAAFSG